MRISLITLVLELSIYVWLCIYRYQEMFAPALEVGPELIFIFASMPYVFFIIRTILKPKPPFLYKLFISLGLLVPEYLMLYWFWIQKMAYFFRGDGYFEYFKTTQVLLFSSFFIIEYLMQLFRVKRRKVKC
jgi:hypothetical protein